MASYKKLGERIRNLRRQKGLTQEKLAEFSKVDPKSVISIELGKRNPTIKTLTKIAKALNTALETLIK